MGDAGARALGGKGERSFFFVSTFLQRRPLEKPRVESPVLARRRWGKPKGKEGAKAGKETLSLLLFPRSLFLSFFLSFSLSLALFLSPSAPLGKRGGRSASIAARVGVRPAVGAP